MKTRKVLVLLLTLVMVFAIAPVASSATADLKPVELSMATSFPTTHGVYSYLEKWTDMVTEATNGKVTITIYASNTLVAAADMHSAVVSGVVDIIETDIAYDIAAFPLSSAIYLPNMGMKSSVTSTHAFNEFYKSDLAEFKGMKIMFAYGMTPFAILSNKPINSLDDMKGLQIRASGFAIGPMNALGARTVGMPITEAYEAAKKGTVEAICNSYETLKGWNFADVVKYGTIVPINPNGNHYIAMNQAVWDSLPAETQTAIEKVNDEIVEMMAPMFDQLDEEGYRVGLEKGIIFNEIKGEELERWKEVLNPIVDKWIEEKTAMGLDAQGTYDNLMEIVRRNIALYEK
jgi:TRAP-type C4-dicarboxylate transport system substrate-binding protein